MYHTEKRFSQNVMADHQIRDHKKCKPQPRILYRYEQQTQHKDCRNQNSDKDLFLFSIHLSYLHCISLDLSLYEHSNIYSFVCQYSSCLFFIFYAIGRVISLPMSASMQAWRSLRLASDSAYSRKKRTTSAAKCSPGYFVCEPRHWRYVAALLPELMLSL